MTRTACRSPRLHGCLSAGFLGVVIALALNATCRAEVTPGHEYDLSYDLILPGLGGQESQVYAPIPNSAGVSLNFEQPTSDLQTNLPEGPAFPVPTATATLLATGKEARASATQTTHGSCEFDSEDHLFCNSLSSTFTAEARYTFTLEINEANGIPAGTLIPFSLDYSLFTEAEINFNDGAPQPDNFGLSSYGVHADATITLSGDLYDPESSRTVSGVHPVDNASTLLEFAEGIAIRTAAKPDLIFTATGYAGQTYQVILTASIVIAYGTQESNHALKTWVDSNGDGFSDYFYYASAPEITLRGEAWANPEVELDPAFAALTTVTETFATSLTTHAIPNPPEILSLSAGDGVGGANLTWTSIVGRQYTVQYSTDMDEWIDIITVPSFDVVSNTNFTEPDVEGGNCFYRVVLVP